jgi:fumarate reductase flavoprotein subunit
MHGFNRLGGNSVAETVVAGMIVGEYVADHCDRTGVDIKTSVVEGFLKREQARIREVIDRSSGEDVYELKKRMQAITMEKVGIFRTGGALQEAVDELRQLLKRSRSIAIKNKVATSNPELVEALRVPRMMKLALSVACGALARTESRGAHAREDHPERNDRDWLKRTLAYWRNESDELPALEYQDLDITQMEIPPGSRGYGDASIIPHPDTAAREERVKEIKASMPKADRFEIQQALMPFDMPEKYRGKNERVGEGFK